MPVDTEVWAETVGDVVREFDALLSQIPASGWESPAASVGWSCWRAAEHVCADFAHYAAQIIGQPRDHYVKFSFDTSRATTPGQLREVVRVSGGLLAAAVRTTGPDCLGWHPHGYFTPAGFAAIGAAEGLVHGHDIAAGLTIAWTPQLPLCERVLSVVFPGAALDGPASAFETLLIQTGRAGRPPHEPPPSWSYAAAAALPLSGSREGILHSSAMSGLLIALVGKAATSSGLRWWRVSSTATWAKIRPSSSRNMAYRSPVGWVWCSSS